MDELSRDELKRGPKAQPMHEPGVVFQVIGQAEEIAAENDGSRVEAVTPALGEVSAVIPDT